MRKAKILANISNILVTAFLVILIPMTIIGTYLIVINSGEIQANTKFRVETKKTIDSLKMELRIERYINDAQRERIKYELDEDQ